MACEEQLLAVENVGSGDDDTARFVVRGCGRTRTYDCTQQNERVECRETHHWTSGDIVSGVAGAGLMVLLNSKPHK
jgi:hypothetical protein